MRLTALDISNTAITDLDPLRGMQLEEFAAADCSLSDLEPLKEAKLQVADLSMTRVANLSPLRGMPLRELRVPGTRVRDIAALRRSKLQRLDLHRTQVTDLSPLAGSQLQSLTVTETPISELTPLLDVPIREIQCSLNLWRDPEVLHGIKTLKTINGRNAAVVLQEMDRKRQAFETWAKSVSEMPADRQADAVGKKLKEANFNFDGKVDAVVAGGVVTELRVVTDAVEDISAVRALAGLKKLSCSGSDKGRGRVADLWPLRGLALTHLDIDRTQVTDVTALRGMPLEVLSLRGSAVTDLSPLVDAPIRSLDGDFALGRDGNALRKLKMLETINGRPAARFLR
jgi:Leucine-rich repeat (LRR) protein